MDWVLKIASFVLLPAAVAVKALCPQHTVAWHVADQVTNVLIGLGVYTSSAAVQAKIALSHTVK